MKLINYEDLHVGMRVRDSGERIGTVTEIQDQHNVFVEYDGGGTGWHCLVEGCYEMQETIDGTLMIPHYDPLYEVDDFNLNFDRSSIIKTFTKKVKIISVKKFKPKKLL